MAERSIQHDFECSVDRFWEETVFSERFNQELFIERLGFERYEVVTQTETPDGFKRVVEAEPKALELPGPLKKVFKKGLGYREEGVYRRSASRYDVTAISHSLPERLQITGVMTVEPLGADRCRRVYVAKANAKVFGVGGLIESRLLDDIEKSYELSARFTRNWLQQA